MLITINGRILPPACPREAQKEVSLSISTWEKIKGIFKAAIDDLAKYGPPPGAMFAAVPMVGLNGGGLIEKLWPLTVHLQDFGFIAGVCMALWGASRFIFGDPGGRQVVWQSILGYVLLLVVPMVFFAIRAALGGGA